jgi:hypothetical protein
VQDGTLNATRQLSTLESANQIVRFLSHHCTHVLSAAADTCCRVCRHARTVEPKHQQAHSLECTGPAAKGSNARPEATRPGCRHLVRVCVCAYVSFIIHSLTRFKLCCTVVFRVKREGDQAGPGQLARKPHTLASQCSAPHLQAAQGYCCSRKCVANHSKARYSLCSGACEAIRVGGRRGDDADGGLSVNVLGDAGMQLCMHSMLPCWKTGAPLLSMHSH